MLFSHRHKTNSKKLKKEVQAENRQLLPLKSRFHKWIKNLGIYTTHRSNFKPWFCIYMIAQWLALERILGYVSTILLKFLYQEHILTSFSITDNEISAFLVDEVIPVLIMIIIANNYRHRSVFCFSAWSICTALIMLGAVKLLTMFTKLNPLSYLSIGLLVSMILACIPTVIAVLLHSHTKIYKKWSHRKFKLWRAISKWVNILTNDVATHKCLILITFVIAFVSQIVSLPFFSLLSGPNLSAPSSSGTNMLASGAWIVIPFSILVAPVFEELMFRVLLTNGINGIFKSIDKKSFNTCKYWCAALLSAMMFAAYHYMGGTNTGVMVTRIIFALILQFVYHKSHSISIPIAVHSLNNLATYAFIISALYF